MKKFLYLIFTIVTLVSPTLLAFEPSEEYVVIVNGQNAVNEVSVNDVRDFYFKRKRQWPGGENVRFIDRNSGSRIRDVFLKAVIGKSSSDVELFWIGQKLYTGNSAPLREASDAATIQFVSSFKGAIGYVSSGASLAEQNVKAVKVISTKED